MQLLSTVLDSSEVSLLYLNIYLALSLFFVSTPGPIVTGSFLFPKQDLY